MKKFDYIIAGGGMAGLSLAYHMLHSRLDDRQVLIVDRQPKTENDRTWSFWSRESSLYDSILYRQWKELQFHSPGYSKTYALPPYRYNMLRGIDFYQHTQMALRKAPNYHFLYGDVSAVNSLPNGAEVVVDGQAYQAPWVFDSLYLPGQFKPQKGRYRYLWQHFKGWIIETQDAIFEPQAPTLFDFRTSQKHGMQFIYILPFSEHQALVEVTLFTGNLLSDEDYDDALQTYLREVLNLHDYEILETEQGQIPMTDQPFPRFPSPYQMTIGTKGGRVKASTGYAFLRTQHDSQAIVRSLLDHNQPTHIPRDRRRARLYDAIMLEVMDRNGERMAEIFTDLFRNNPIDRIFRFLDEETSPLDEVKVFASVPSRPFIEALFHTGFRSFK